MDYIIGEAVARLEFSAVIGFTLKREIPFGVDFLKSKGFKVDYWPANGACKVSWD